MSAYRMKSFHMKNRTPVGVSMMTGRITVHHQLSLTTISMRISVKNIIVDFTLYSVHHMKTNMWT